MADTAPPIGRLPGHDVWVEHRDEGPVVVKRAASAHVDRLRAEARLLSEFAHPGLVRPVALERVGNQVQLVTAHAGSHTLDTAPPTMPSLATRQLGQLAAALAHLHQHGIAHRRLEPTHVVLASDGRATLCGLGDALTDDAAGLAADLASLRHLGSLQLDRCRLPGAGPRRRAETDLRRHLRLLLADPQLDARTLADRLAALWRSTGGHTSFPTVETAGSSPGRARRRPAGGRPAGPDGCGSATPGGRHPRGRRRVRRLAATLGALAVATGAWQLAASADGSAPRHARAELTAAPQPPPLERSAPGPAPPASPVVRKPSDTASTAGPGDASRAPNCGDLTVDRCGTLDDRGDVRFGGREYRLDHDGATPALYLIDDWNCDGSETLAVLGSDQVLQVYATWPSDAADEVVPAPRQLPTPYGEVDLALATCDASVEDPDPPAATHAP